MPPGKLELIQIGRTYEAELHKWQETITLASSYLSLTSQNQGNSKRSSERASCVEFCAALFKFYVITSIITFFVSLQDRWRKCAKKITSMSWTVIHFEPCMRISVDHLNYGQGAINSSNKQRIHNSNLTIQEATGHRPSHTSYVMRLNIEVTAPIWEKLSRVCYIFIRGRRRTWKT